jgi:hypothetical protein
MNYNSVLSKDIGHFEFPPSLKPGETIEGRSNKYGQASFKPPQREPRNLMHTSNTYDDQQNIKREHYSPSYRPANLAIRDKPIVGKPFYGSTMSSQQFHNPRQKCLSFLSLSEAEIEQKVTHFASEHGGSILYRDLSSLFSILFQGDGNYQDSLPDWVQQKICKLFDEFRHHPIEPETCYSIIKSFQEELRVEIVPAIPTFSTKRKEEDGQQQPPFSPIRSRKLSAKRQRSRRKRLTSSSSLVNPEELDLEGSYRLLFASKGLSTGSIRSSYETDVGKDEEDEPAHRPLVYKSGFASTTRDMFKGTSRDTYHIPGYGGYIPLNPRHTHVSDQYECKEPRPLQTDLRLYARQNILGYTGHLPQENSFNSERLCGCDVKTMSGFSAKKMIL